MMIAKTFNTRSLFVSALYFFHALTVEVLSVEKALLLFFVLKSVYYLLDTVIDKDGFK